MKKIETGVDKLVALIEEKKRVSVGQAAKLLGVSTMLVQEWADFLEEDGLISIDYSLSKVYLVERKLTKKEVDKKEKEYVQKKDAFIRKVETTTKAMEKDSIGFKKMKSEFEHLQKDIGGEIGFVEKELKELEYYENLKNSIDKDVQKQKKEYQKFMETSHREINQEQRRFQELVATVSTERQKIGGEKSHIRTLEEKEKLLQAKIDEMTKLVNDVRQEIKQEEHDIEIDEKNLEKIDRLVEQIERRLKTKKDEAILPLLKLSEEHRARIEHLQDQILDKLEQKKKEVLMVKGQSQKVYVKLKKFFDKKEKAEKLLRKIEQERQELGQEYDALIQKAQAFHAINKSATVKAQIKDLEQRFKEVEEHKKHIHSEIESLTKLVKG